MVDLPAVRLAKAHDKNAVVGHGAVLRETFVRRDQCAGFRQRQSPKLGVGESLIGSSANVFHIVAECTKSIHGHPGDVLVNQDAHPLEVGDLDRRDLLLGETRGVIERCHDVLAGQVWILG
jgi:hypothetical protein